MSAVIETVVPVFGLIALGAVAGRTRLVSETAAKGLPEFVFRIAMPALLFRTMLTAQLPDVSPLAFWGAYFGAALATWLTAALATGVLLRRPQSDAAAIAMGATFSNSVMMGVPIALSHFGPAAGAPLALVLAADVTLLWLLGTLHLAVADSAGGRSLVRQLGMLLWRLITNPIILGSLVGILWRQTGLGLAPLLDRIITMLGAAAVPGALVSLGLSLLQFRARGEIGAVVVITVLKLAVMPALVWLLAVRVLDLPPLPAAVAVLLAALPVGANAYLFAVNYQRGVAPVAGAIAVSTVLSLITVTALLVVLGPS